MGKSDIERRRSTGWYAEVQPPPALSHLVACLWEMRTPTIAAKRLRILPNGCIDIVLYAGDTSHGEGMASIVRPPHRSFIVGSTLRSFVVRSAGCGHVVGASLLPTGVQPLLGVPARIIGESIALLDDILGSTAGEIEETTFAGSDDRCLERLGDALVRLAARGEAHPIVARAVHRVRIAGGRKRMDVLAEETNLSARQLERVFREHVGLSPKTYSRLVRFDAAARGIRARGTLSWTHFALVHGYGDQAHFINDFKEFAGVTPERFEDELAAGELRSH